MADNLKDLDFDSLGYDQTQPSDQGQAEQILSDTQKLPVQLRMTNEPLPKSLLGGALSYLPGYLPLGVQHLGSGIATGTLNFTQPFASILNKLTGGPGTAPIQPPKGAMGTIGNILGSLGISSVALGAEKIPGVFRGIEALASKIPSIAGAIRTIPSALTGAAYGGLAAAGLPGTPLSQTDISGGAEKGALLGALTHGLLAPFTGIGATPEAAAAAKGVPFTPADIAQRTIAQKAYYGLRGASLTGVEQRASKISDAIDQNAKNITGGLLGNVNPVEIPNTIKSELTNNLEQVKTNNTNLYKQAEDYANKIGFKTPYGELTETKNAADAALKRYGVNLSSGTKTDLKGLSKFIDNGSEKLINYPTLHNNIIKYTEDASDAFHSGNMKDYRALTNVKNALLADLNKTALDRGDNKLYDMLTKARTDYKNNLAPYYDSPAYSKIINQPNAPDTIDKILTHPDSTKVLNDLSPGSKKLVTYQHLDKTIKESPEGGNITNADKLFNTWSALKGQNAPLESKLIDPQTREQISTLGKQLTMGKYARTVAKEAEQLPKYSVKSLAYPLGSLGATGAATKYLGPAGGMTAGTALFGLPPILARILGSSLTKVPTTTLAKMLYLPSISNLIGQ